MAARFRDRADAGRQLAALLTAYAGRDDVLVLALPRGGVPVAYEVAVALPAPLDVFLVRKLGVPGHEELAMGAVAMGGVRVLNDEVVKVASVTASEIDAVTAAEQQVLERRGRAWRGDRLPPVVEERVLLLVDDGLATGATMRAAATALRAQGPAAVVVAVPTAPPSTCREMAKVADEVVCVLTPEDFHAVGQWYDDFSPTTDEEVRDLLARAEAAVGPSPRPSSAGG